MGEVVLKSVAMRAWFLIHPDGLVLRREGDAVDLPTEEDARALGVVAEEAHAIGALGEAEALAAPVSRDATLHAPLATVGPFDLRKVYPALGKERFALAGTANQIVQWAETHRYCGRCATPTVREPNERAMRCPKCKLLAYPRISPAVIVLVRRGDEALLARGASFPLPMYSTLAGFVEVGETLEQTIAREIREEVGVLVKDVKYFGSQPWPFPHSLMIAFTAEWAGGEIAADPKEIVDAAWFRADALPMVSPPISIARWMIDAWVAEIAAKR
jgi:NAD+ diphosphatase